MSGVNLQGDGVGGAYQDGLGSSVVVNIVSTLVFLCWSCHSEGLTKEQL